MMMKYLYKTVFAFIFMISLTTQAQIIVAPTDDMTTYQNGCAAGDPSIDKLWLANFSNADCYDNILIKFDLSDYAGETLSNVKLKLYHNWHNPHNSPTPSKIYAINETWDEDTWNHLDNVSHLNTIYATPTFTSQLGWVEIDITNLVNDWLSGAVVNEGLVIIPNTGSKLATFHSKEYSDTALHPYLEFEITTGIKDEISIFDFSMYPNPVSHKATVEFELKLNQIINISITNSTGQQIQQVCNQEYQAGKFSNTFSVENLPNGLYFLNIKSSNKTIIKKLVVNK